MATMIEVGDEVEYFHDGYDPLGYFCYEGTGVVSRVFQDRWGDILVDISCDEKWPHTLDVKYVNLLKRANPATSQQLAYLKTLGATTEQMENLSQLGATVLIDNLKLWKDSYPCHYCGQPARKWGFFGEVVCDGCR